MDTARAYIACPLDLNATRRAAEFAKSLRRNAIAKGWELAFVPPPSLHLTLRWLGEIDLGLIAPVRDALGALAQTRGPLRVHLGGLTVAGAPEAPTHLGLALSPELLQPLADDLDARLRELGLERTSPGFRPWLPIARVSRAATALADLSAGSADLGIATVHELVLYRCDPPRVEVEPTALARFPLAPKPRGPAPGG